MSRLFAGLWRHADFRKLWAGQTISLFGSQITLLALAGGSLAISVPMLIAAQFLSSIGGPITAINQQSLRQAITPDAMQGRVNGTARFIGASMGPIGGITAGLLGEHIGLRSTLVLATIGIQTGVFLLLIPSILKFRGLTE